tara:strand:+ start:23969 stop:25591 length:1623 start_codon:yes stop_codon:yes gene_type:complete
MNGLMMTGSLLISSILKHAARFNADVEIVSRKTEGGIHRYTFSDAAKRSCQLANALKRLGVEKGDRIATLGWNNFRHLEIYYAVSGSGAICHTINPRLFMEQIAYIIGHAEDKWVFVDITFVPMLEKLADQLSSVQGYVIMTDRKHMPDTSLENVLCFEELIVNEASHFEWPELDEKTASSLCYTSGTTGNPKGVLYSHRSTILHAYASCMKDTLGLSCMDVVMPVVPMFHVNAWGIPYSALMTGSKLVLPGSDMDGASLYQMINDEGVTVTAGVPTIWSGLLAYLEKNNLNLNDLQRVIVGGSACPEVMITTFSERYNVDTTHAWGMTETSPIGTVNTMTTATLALSAPERLAIKAKQGRPVFGVDIKIVDDDLNELPRNGRAFGHLKICGPWVCSEYYKSDSQDGHEEQGWFSTGDVATIDENSYMKITDRSKDVIKSGGEWISSIDIENVAVAHPNVIEAAVISKPDERWGERPVLFLVTKAASELSEQEILNFCAGKIAKWSMPDEVVFINELPHTATGKILKMKLREDYMEKHYG